MKEDKKGLKLRQYGNHKYNGKTDLVLVSINKCTLDMDEPTINMSDWRLRWPSDLIENQFCTLFGSFRRYQCENIVKFKFTTVCF